MAAQWKARAHFLFFPKNILKITPPRLVVGPNSWDFWTYANACGSFSWYLVTTLPSFFMNNEEIIFEWEVHQKQHAYKAYYQGVFIETKCSTDTHHVDWLGGQTIQAVHFTFLSCLSLPQVQAVESLIEKLKEERVRLIAFKKYHLPNNGKANHLPNRSELGYIGYSYFMLFHFPKTVTMSCRFGSRIFS